MHCKVSIIIPVYNTEKYIRQCLGSVIKQSLKEIEIIVINDGSTDSSLSIINEFAKNDSRIKVINKENGGVSSSRNAGLEIAKGEFIQCLDADDWLEVNAYFELYQYAKENDLDMVVYDFHKIYGEEKRYIQAATNELRGINSGDKYLKSMMRCQFVNYVGNKFVKRGFYSDIRFPTDISHGEDVNAMSKLFFEAKNIGYLQKPFFNYRRHEEQMTALGMNGTLISKGYETLFSVNGIKRYLEEKNAFHEYKNLYPIFFIVQVSNLYYLDKDKIFDQKAYENAIVLLKEFLSVYQIYSKNKSVSFIQTLKDQVCCTSCFGTGPLASVQHVQENKLICSNCQNSGIALFNPNFFESEISIRGK